MGQVQIYCLVRPVVEDSWRFRSAGRHRLVVEDDSVSGYLMEIGKANREGCTDLREVVMMGQVVLVGRRPLRRQAVDRNRLMVHRPVFLMVVVDNLRIH